MKEAILSLLNANLAGAEDNEYRTSLMFWHLDGQQLDKEYGESGRTCREIWSAARRDVDRAVAMKAWFEEHAK